MFNFLFLSIFMIRGFHIDTLIMVALLVDAAYLLKYIPFERRKKYIIILSLMLASELLVSLLGGIVPLLGAAIYLAVIFPVIQVVVICLYVLRWRPKLIKAFPGTPSASSAVTAQQPGTVMASQQVARAKKVHTATSVIGTIIGAVALFVGLFMLAGIIYFAVILYQCSRPGAKCM